MITQELPFPRQSPQETIENFCQENGLNLSEPLSLKSCPNGVHWHISHPHERGTLELTWSPREERFWTKVAANRNAQWIKDEMQRLVAIFA